jgi:hypothetical protein
MEAHLAKLADLIIIIVESAGTLAELGAFSISHDLRRKLLPIVDVRYKEDPSFINNGPLQWIDKESEFRPTIYASLDAVLGSADQVEERLKRIPKARSFKVSDLAMSPKHLLFFIADLVAVIYPATLETVGHYLAAIAPSILSTEINVPTLVNLGVAMNLLRTISVSDSGVTELYYAPADPTGVGRPFHHSRLLYLEGKRAEHASVLLAIPQAKQVLQQLGSAA